MKQVLRSLGVVCALVGAAATHIAAQAPVSIKGDVVNDLARTKELMDKLVAAMPDDKFTYKSTPAQRDFAAQVQHIAQANVMLGAMIGGKTAAPVLDKTATTKAGVTKAMDNSFTYLSALANEQTDQTMLEGVDAKFLGRSTRARVFFAVIGHTQDIYGQLVVYLRLNGVTPPASQRP